MRIRAAGKIVKAESWQNGVLDDPRRIVLESQRRFPIRRRARKPELSLAARINLRESHLQPEHAGLPSGSNVPG